jgi:hypothetical protein
VMAITGTLLWFDDFFVSLGLPKGILDVVLIIHYYEAWLAFLAIVVWHGYGVLFGPHVYPMNPAWISGRMPRDMYSHEHPDAPKLKVRSFRKVRYEEEEEGDEQDEGEEEASPPQSE